MTDKEKPKPIIIDPNDTSWADCLPKTPEERDKWKREQESNFLILDDYRQIFSESTKPIPKNLKKIIKKLTKYNTGIEIIYGKFHQKIKK